jgi:transketolase
VLDLDAEIGSGLFEGVSELVPDQPQVVRNRGAVAREATAARPRHPHARPAHAWRAALERPEGPKGLALTRQSLPVLAGTSAEGVSRGGYVLADASDGTPKVILIATGSELQIAAEAREQLEADGVPTRVVSMPCVEWFDAQDADYRESVLPAAVKARVSVEAGIAMPWHRFTGDAGENVSIEHFGASADYKTLFREFGFTTENVVAAARRSLANV